MEDLIGQYFGRYHILERLGEGGMATVYKAYDTRLEREVAVKVILPGKKQNSTFLKRFERESKTLAALSHPNIVSVIDYGEQEGLPYLVMEFIAGGMLKNRMGNPISWRAASELVLPLARALSFAHSKKIIHRDVKPANILMTQSGDPMLSDFGIAKLLENEETLELTGAGVGIGTPEYMAPEQGVGQSDERSDVYALGVVLYELVTGHKPYTADTPLAVLMKKNTEPLPRPKQYVPALPDGVEFVLVKALARNPGDRYQNMDQFALALETLLSGKGQTIAEPRLLTTKTMPPGPVVANPSLNDVPPAGRRAFPLGWIILGVGVCLLVAALAVGGMATAWMGGGDPSFAFPGPAVTQPIPTATREKIPTLAPSPTAKPSPTEPPTATTMPTPEWSGILSVRMPTLNEIRAERPLSLWDANLVTVEDMYQPGVNSYTGQASSNEEYLFPVYWCATSGAILTQNMENITTTFLVSGEVIPEKYLFNYNYDTNTGWSCNYYAVILSNWSRGGRYTLEIKREVTVALSDGQRNYAAGEYTYRLIVNVP